jgi:molecular chaperone IbpA
MNNNIPMPYERQFTHWETPKTKQKTPAEILNQLVTQLAYRGVGFNNHSMFFSELANFANKPSFPPYDILSSEENKYEIRMALAGFKKDDLDITFQNQVLTVKTKPMDEEDNTDSYFHKGIAMRAFTLSFPLAEYVTVTTAEMADGVLTISLERELPEEMKPKTIKIK